MIHVCYTTMIQRVSVRKVMQDFYHQQEELCPFSLHACPSQFLLPPPGLSSFPPTKFTMAKDEGCGFKIYMFWASLS